MPDTTKRPDLLLAQPLSDRLPPDQVATVTRLYEAVGSHLAAWFDDEMRRGTKPKHIVAAVSNLYVDFVAGLATNHWPDKPDTLYFLATHAQFILDLLHAHLNLHRIDAADRQRAMPSKGMH